VIHEADDTIGAPRVTAELNDGTPADVRINHQRVARVVRAAGIAGYRKRRRVLTTIPEQNDQKVPDPRKRDLTAAAATDATSATLPTSLWPAARTSTRPPSSTATP
jgi:hypothetical protein